MRDVMVVETWKVNGKLGIGLAFGPTRETGVWFAPFSQWRVLWSGHDSLYMAAWRFRLRIMKPRADGKLVSEWRGK